MKEIVGVMIDTENNMSYYDTNQLKLKKNITVIVETEKNIEFGKVCTDVHPIDESKLKEPLRKIIRIASKNDYYTYKTNKKKAAEALKKCKELVKELKLDMSVIDAVYTFDKDQLLFHFTADNRIDFRDLARELASIYKTRIELRQIGVRDKAKKVCGQGVCGQKLCCSRFLNEFTSVSISMAKNQNLSLNPTKINGVCGRLLCCLKYEDDIYKEYRKDLPEVGKTVELKEGKGKVVSVDVLAKKYMVEIPDVGMIEVQQ